MLSFDFEDGSHDDDDVVDELRVLFGTDHLSVGIEELVHLDLDLIEQNRITQRVQCVTEQVLNVLLNLHAEFLVLTNQIFQTIADELHDGTIVQIGTDRFHRRSPTIGRDAVLTRSVLHGQPNASQGTEKASHVRPFVEHIFDFVFTRMHSCASFAELRVTPTGQSARLVGVDRRRAGRRASAGEIFDAFRINGEELRGVLLADKCVVPRLFIPRRGVFDATQQAENSFLQRISSRRDQRGRRRAQLISGPFILEEQDKEEFSLSRL